MKIHWYPGHIAKAKRKILEFLKFTDIVLYFLDARIPKASRIIYFEKEFQNKEIIVILNKIDLAEKNITENWIESLKKNFRYVIPLQANTQTGINILKDIIFKIKKDMAPKKILKDTKIMAVGIPNIGKSSLINRLAGKKSAKVGKLAGVTKTYQWINFAPDLYVLDQPGVFFPKINDDEEAWKLAVTGAIKLEVLPLEEVALKLIELLMERSCIGKENPHKYLENTGIKAGFLKNNMVDIDKTSINIIKKFQTGKFGPLSLDVK